MWEELRLRLKHRQRLRTPLAAPLDSQPHGGNSTRPFIGRASICYSPGGEAACARCGRPCKFGSGTCLPNGCISNVANICNCANALCCCKHITFLATACTGARQLYECHFKTKPTATITNFTNIYNCANAVCCCLLMHQHRRNSLQRRTPTHVRNRKTHSHQCKQMKLSMAVCPLW